jgi:hypothetical protein
MEKIKKWMKAIQLKSYCQKVFSRILRYYNFSEGGKSLINIEKLLISSSFLICPLLVGYFLMNGENTAYVGKTPNSLTQNIQKVSTPSESYNYPVQQNINIASSGQNTINRTNTHTEIKLSAKQILIRESSTISNGFNIGSNLIAELQSTIDTRDPSQTVRAVLPYGGKSRDGSSEIPKGTLLLGQVSYPGKGEKVFIQFQQAILPDGKTIKIAAQVLDPKDYSTGLNGEIQSQAKNRTLSIMGYSAISAMGNVLTEKESIGQYQVEAKANPKNAMLAGVSRAAEIEASRLQEQAQTDDYVQVDAGTAIVISLTQGFSL